MPYIGIFTEESIQKAIDKAGEKLGEGESGIVVHLDPFNEISASVIKRFGTHISVEGAALFDLKDGFVFDKEHLKVEANLIIRF